MPQVIASLNQATKILQANVEVLREEAGTFAHAGAEGKSVMADQGATMLEAACILIEAAVKRI